MSRFLLRRLAFALITLVITSFLLFAMAQVLPGDVGRTILGPYATQAQVAAVDHQLGVDKPLLVRYWSWITGFIRGDWGTSYLLNTAVRPMVLDRLVNSLALAAFAMLITVPISIGLGVVAALNYGKAADRAITITGLSLIALPEFVAGVLLIVLFSIEVHWFPSASNVPSWNPLDILHQFLLPAIPLVLVLFGYISRMARAGTIVSLSSNYTRTAILKGLPSSVVIWRHVLRNSLLPTISVISVQFGYLVGSLVVIETLFSYPGIGKLVYDSAVGHDLPMLEATVLVVAIIYYISTLLADVLYAALNPRIRLSD